MSIPHSELKRLLHYDPETGFWTRLVGVKGFAAGSPVGYIGANGYRYIGVRRKSFLSSRLAWFYMTGEWPINQVDHRDRTPANDRWNNLREATQSENNANFGLRKDNPAGLKGVSWDKRKGKWYARIKHNGKGKFLGYSDCPAAAHFSYVVAADLQYGEFSRAR
jgi:hypothetical protein